jgi:hypothetical protein
MPMGPVGRLHLTATSVSASDPAGACFHVTILKGDALAPVVIYLSTLLCSDFCTTG